MATQVLGIDLGGTTIKFGRFLADGSCLESFSLPTPQPSFPQAVLATLTEGIERLKTADCVAIGLGMPGPTDPQGRIAKLAINLPHWQNIPLADWVETACGLPTVLENDANCAGLGEAWLGAGQAFQDFILLTLGTGVGGAVFLGGELFVGHRGAGGELGLLTLDYRGPVCHSGNSGSLEQHISAQAIQRETQKNGAELAQLAQKGVPEAIAYWENYGRLLGAGLANLIYVLTPEAVIIGGGISASAEYFFPTVEAEIEKRVLLPSRENLQILVAQLGNRAGMIGAARLAWQKLGSLA
ncbi:MAG: ROK family protein [Microcystaceae cyanobacterium]